MQNDNQITADAGEPTKSILVVDDSKSIRTLFRIYLRKLPVTVQFAEDGLEALELVRAKAPDLIILDLMMPHMDGLTVLDRLDGDETTRNIPRIIVTSRQDVSSFEKFLKTGVTTYMLKPVVIDRLLPLIHAALEHGAFSPTPPQPQS